MAARTFFIFLIAGVVCAFVRVHFLSAQPWRAEVDLTMRAERGRIHTLQEHYSSVLDDLKNKRSMAETARSQFASEESHLNGLEDEERTLAERQKAIRADLQLAVERPDLVSKERVAALAEDNSEVQRKRSAKGLELGAQRQRTEQSRRRFEQAASDVRSIERVADQDQRDLRRLASSLTVIVQGITGQCIMTGSISPDQCKQRALEDAEKQAVEIGGQALIKTVTEVVNFQVVRDEITRDVRASIIHKDVKPPEYKTGLGEGDFGKYYVSLTAAVQNRPSQEAESFGGVTGLSVKSGPTPGQESSSWDFSIADYDPAVQKLRVFFAPYSQLAFTLKSPALNEDVSGTGTGIGISYATESYVAVYSELHLGKINSVRQDPSSGATRPSGNFQAFSAGARFTNTFGHWSLFAGAGYYQLQVSYEINDGALSGGARTNWNLAFSGLVFQAGVHYTTVKRFFSGIVYLTPLAGSGSGSRFDKFEKEGTSIDSAPGQLIYIPIGFVF